MIALRHVILTGYAPLVAERAGISALQAAGQTQGALMGAARQAAFKALEAWLAEYLAKRANRQQRNL